MSSLKPCPQPSPQHWEGGMDSFPVTFDPSYPHFGLVDGPTPHEQHPNQQKGLDLYVRVINFDTGETCFKKLYENKRGLHFKHTGYSSMYLDDFTDRATVIPFQVQFPTKDTPNG